MQKKPSTQFVRIQKQKKEVRVYRVMETTFEGFEVAVTVGYAPKLGAPIVLSAKIRYQYVVLTLAVVSV